MASTLRKAPHLAQQQNSDQRYVLITAARNEEAYIENTISCVVSQTLRPLRWVIVSDGSTDRTDEIVSRYAEKHDFIELLRVNDRGFRDFASKVYAVNLAAERLRSTRYSFIGHLDADVSFGTQYMEELLAKLRLDPTIGIAGGFIYEELGGVFEPRATNRVESVAGAVQMFRRECYEALGSFLPMRFGGEDWHAEVRARMNGWRVRAFPDLEVRHHRLTGTAGGRLRGAYRMGLMDHSMGCDWTFEVARMLKRMSGWSASFYACVRFFVFVWAHCSRKPRPVAPELVKYLRGEQRARLRNLWRRTHCNLGLGERHVT